MTYPVPTEIQDPWERGRVYMFARIVEIQNKHPKWIDDAVVEELYREVRDSCRMEETRAVYVGNERITE